MDDYIYTAKREFYNKVKNYGTKCVGYFCSLTRPSTDSTIFSRDFIKSLEIAARGSKSTRNREKYESTMPKEVAENLEVLKGAIADTGLTLPPSNSSSSASSSSSSPSRFFVDDVEIERYFAPTVGVDMFRVLNFPEGYTTDNVYRTPTDAVAAHGVAMSFMRQQAALEKERLYEENAKEARRAYLARQRDPMSATGLASMVHAVGAQAEAEETSYGEAATTYRPGKQVMPIGTEFKRQAPVPHTQTRYTPPPGPPLKFPTWQDFLDSLPDPEEKKYVETLPPPRKSLAPPSVTKTSTPSFSSTPPSSSSSSSSSASPPPEQNLKNKAYAILGVKEGVSPSDLKKAYMRKARETHPDKNPSDQKERYTQLFQEVANAYETLTKSVGGRRITRKSKKSRKAKKSRKSKKDQKSHKSHKSQKSHKSHKSQKSHKSHKSQSRTYSRRARR